MRKATEQSKQKLALGSKSEHVHYGRPVSWQQNTVNFFNVETPSNQEVDEITQL